MPESSRTPRSDPGSPEEVRGFCPATISSAPLGTPQVTPNDTQRHFSARIWAFWAPEQALCHPTRPSRAKAPVLSDFRRCDGSSQNEAIFEGDETVDYAFMGQDPEAADNRWLREAFEKQVPV